MSGTIRTPKVYRSRREFLKAVMKHRSQLLFAINSNPVAAHNENPLLSTITTDTLTTESVRPKASKWPMRHANRHY